MATLKLLVFAAACLYATASPQEPPVARNTIFGDERLEGEVFEKVDAFEDIVLYNDEDNPYRLPTTTRPRHYNIFWTTHITDAARTYDGRVEIELYATEANVNQIVMHSYHHTVTLLQLTTEAGVVVPTTWETETDYHFLRINLVDNGVLNYVAGTQVIYRLTIEFNAPMRTDMYGIYESWFRNNPTDTTISWMAATQFQATSARYAFPCYDEPSFKATFTITITRPQAYNSWSCTRLATSTASTTIPNYFDDAFYTTPIMSTYLLAIIVAQYTPIEHFEGTVLMYEVIARPGAIDNGQGDYAFDVGQLLLSNMSAHTDIDYFSVNPNLKMTQAAIPDFGAGAMENWGLLTYREAYLLHDEDHTSGYFKQMIAYILSHEIAHMWFGNLVTCDWWDVLWLNEGFARYYQYFLTHWVEDYMGLDTRFITEQVHSALLSDSANNPHPLTNPGIGSPGAVSGMFSTLTYNKGAAVIRMTEHLLGFDVHETGLRNYLAARREDVALPIHLFEALQNAGVAAGAISEYPSDFSVIDYYRSWTEQGGVPVVNVEVNHQTGNMFITQRRFNINTGYSSTNANWIIPITFATASNPDFENTKPTHIIRDSLTIINHGSIGDQWVIFNKQQIGYFRVNYDDYTWDLIVRALKSEDRTLIHEYNRAQIVNDVFQYARSGIMTYSRAFTILSFLEFETEYAPWVAAMTGFSWIRNRLVGTPQLSQINEMVGRWATRVMDQITYYPRNDDTFMTKYLRYQMGQNLCAMNVNSCRIAANMQFAALRATPSVEVPPDNRIWVYCNGLRDGQPADFDFLWSRFLNENLYTEKITLLQSMGCTPYANGLSTILNEIQNPTNRVVRRQDYSTAFNNVLQGNEGNTQIVMDYVVSNYAALSAVEGVNPASWLQSVAGRLRTEDAVDEFQGWAWQNQGLLGNSYQGVFNAAGNSRQSIRWAAEVSGDFDNYFVYGEEPFEPSTAEPLTTTESVTEAEPVLIEPESPNIPGSAVTSSISMFLVTLGAVVAFRV